MAPRCGKPMRRHERAGRPVLEDPACGRPEDHPGPCRSTAALARIARYEADRWRNPDFLRHRARFRASRAAAPPVPQDAARPAA